MRVPLIQIYVTPARPTAPVRPDAPVRVIADPSIAIEVRMNAPPAAARCLFPVDAPAHVQCRRTLFPPIPGEEDEESDELEWTMPPAEIACRRFFSTLPTTELVSDRVFTLFGAFVDFMTASGGQGRRAYHVEQREVDPEGISAAITISGCILLENDRPGEIIVRDIGFLPLRLDNLPLLLREIKHVFRSTKPCFQGVNNIFVEVPQQSKFLIPSGCDDCTDLDMQRALRLFYDYGFQGVPKGAYEGVDLEDYHWSRYGELAGFQKCRIISQ